jgi:arginine utilization protein RocB
LPSFEGKGPRTLALAGRYDVVSIEDYREFGLLAFKPEELLAALIADLESRPLNLAEQRALEEESGFYCWGDDQCRLFSAGARVRRNQSGTSMPRSR